MTQSANKKFDLADIARTAGILFVIAAVVALLLSGVYEITKDRIAEIEEETRSASMAEVMPDADTFEEIDASLYDADSITAAYADGALVGYCVELGSNGFGGEISLMVGVDLDAVVTGVVILDHDETAGMGAKADSPDFLDQYIGRTGTITVKTNSETDIDAITAATITSKAVTSGVNSAISIVEELTSQGGSENVQ